VITAQQLDQLEPQQMRAAVLALMQQINSQDERIARHTYDHVYARLAARSISKALSVHNC
jgi:hypothetical protein